MKKLLLFLMLPLLGVAHMGISPKAQDNTLQEAKTPKQQLNVTGPNRTTPMTTAYYETVGSFTVNDLIINNGHGQTWAEINFVAPINQNIPQSKWSTVEFVDYEYSVTPNTTFFSYTVNFDESEGVFRAQFLSHDLDIHGNIYLIYSCETNLYPTSVHKQGQQTFSYWYGNLQKYDGHGQTWYELYRDISISGVAQENWDSVQYKGFTQSGNSSFYYDDTWFDSSTGVFHVYLRTRNQYAFGSVTIKYEYDKEIHYPVVDAYGETAHQVKANEFEYFNGHGQTCYIYQKSFKIDLDPFFWDDVVIEEWGYSSGLQFYAGDVDFNANTGMISVDLRSHNAANGNLYILYSYRAEQVLKSISLSGNYKRNYFVGETLSYSGLRVTANYYCGVSSHEVTNYAISSNVNMNQHGSYRINISYTENEITKSTGYYVTVREPGLESISLIGDYLTTFRVGDEFNCDGLVVVAHFENGVSSEVSDFEIDDAEVDMSQPGVYEVSIGYTFGNVTKWAYYDITVEWPDLALLSITLSGNYKTTFVQGEEFNYDGLVVTAHYLPLGEGYDRVVTDYSIIAVGYNPLRTGSYVVVVYYTENDTTVSASYSVSVVRGRIVLDPIFEPFPGKL